MIFSPVPNFLFCGLTQKEKEARMASFSFSFLLLSLLNNLLWLAYSQKIGDENIGIPAMVGKLIILLYLLMIGCLIFGSLSSQEPWWVSS